MFLILNTKIEYDTNELFLPHYFCLKHIVLVYFTSIVILNIKMLLVFTHLFKQI